MFYRSKTRKDFVIILFVLLCSISLLVTYELILWYEAQVNALRASRLANAFQQICIENSREISRFLPISFG